MLAIIGLLLFINRNFANILEIGFTWVIALPIIIYTSEFGLKNGLILMLSTCLFGVVIGVNISTFFYLIIESVIGLYYGNGVYRKYSNRKLLIGAMLIDGIAMLIGMVTMGKLLGFDFNQDIKDISMIFQYLNLGKMYTPKQISIIIRIIVFSSPILLGLMEGIIIHLITHLLFKKLNLVISPLKSPLDFHIGKVFGYISLVFLVLTFGCAFIKSKNTFTMFLTLTNALLMLVIGYRGLIKLSAQYYQKRWLALCLMLLLFVPVVGQLDLIVLYIVGIKDVLGVNK